MADADDLDQLLDSALDDFTKLDLAPARGVVAERDGLVSSTPGPAAPSVQGLGLGPGLPDLKTKRKGKQQKAPPPKGSHASEALEQLTRQTREAIRGLESATSASTKGEAELDNEAMVEDFVKQFEELAGSQDMESIVQTMMQQLLSKEMLHEPMNEIGQRYPKWLEDHKEGLTPEEYDRYHRQYELILDLNEVYENDPNNFQKIVDLMQKMQECGQPPSDMVQELAPDFDISNLGSHLPPELLTSPDNCCIM